MVELFTKYIIRGKWKFFDVPTLLKTEVAELLEEKGREDLIE
ncbi:MAG: CD1375 family protein [Bacillota bacterium]|nr:CD1375 family protein [Virgibacillus sp. AGTR]